MSSSTYRLEVAPTRRFRDLQVDVAPARPAADGIDFTLIGTAVWSTHDMRVGFTARHVGARRLVLTQLELKSDTAAPIGASVLRDFPATDLLAHLREWIVSDGRPHGAVAQGFTARGMNLSELVGHDAWLDARQQFIGMLKDTVDGPSRGRRTTRDGAYLKDLASDYVRIAFDNKQNPRVELAARRHRSTESIASDIRLARHSGWLADTEGKGRRHEQRPGALLIAAWEQEGYPKWFLNHQAQRDERSGQ